jgi:hypothetical protein
MASLTGQNQGGTANRSATSQVRSVRRPWNVNVGAVGGVVRLELRVRGQLRQQDTRPAARTGRPTTASDVGDIDIAVLARTRIPAADRFDVQEQLAARIGRDVDHQTRQDAIILNLAETS